MRRPEHPVVWASWLLSRVAVVSLLASSQKFWGIPLRTDVTRDYFQAAQRMMHGAVPYLNFRYEYPAGTLPFVAVGYVLGDHGRTGFLVVWVLMMVVLDAVVLSALLHLSRGRPVWRAAATWLIGGAALFPVFLRNDLIPVAGVAAGFALTFGRRHVLAGASWALATLAKLWPGPPMVALALARSPGRWKFIAGSGVVTVVAAAWLTSEHALIAMVQNLRSYQGHRPIEVESVLADLKWLHAAEAGTHLRVVYSYGSLNLVGGRSATLAAIGTALTGIVGVLLVVAAVAIRVVRGREIPRPGWAWLFAAYVSASLIVAPVLSAQYALWIVGVAAIVVAVDRGRAGTVLAATSAAIAVLTTAVYPGTFNALLRSSADAIAVLTARNLLYVAVFVVAVLGTVASLRRPEVASEAGVPTASRTIAQK